MAEYFSWTVTGVITGLKTWSEADYGDVEDASADGTGSVQIASRMVEKQSFFIKQRDGREIGVSLADSGLVLRNGHVVTAVWVARKGLNHGFCVIIDNHTTGAQVRLAHNIKLIRPKVSLAVTAKFGLLATLPVLLATGMWLLVPGSVDSVGMDIFIIIALVAMFVLFTVGLIVSKVVLDYLQADDHQKIWQVAEQASTEIRTSFQEGPRSRPRV